VDLPVDFLAARSYLAVARSDQEKRFYLSSCLTAQKAAEVALQSYIRTRGMNAGAESLPVLLASVPGKTAELERASKELERFRIDMSSPYRSYQGPEPEPTLDAAIACCEAAAAIVAHVEVLFVETEP
jgi:HEPN domain-containing protein